MPAFGFSAVPSPTKNRMKSAIGLAVNEPVAEAPGVSTSVPAAAPINGSPLVVAAAALAVPACEPTSRLVAANAAHANGPAAGTPPSLPAPSHDSRLPLNPVTAPRAPAAVITGSSGASAATGTLTASTSGAVDGVGVEDSAGELPCGSAARAAGVEVSIGATTAGGAATAGAESAAGADSKSLSATVTTGTAGTEGAELFRRPGVAADPPGAPALGDPALPSTDSAAETSSAAASEAAPEPRTPPRPAADREPPRAVLDVVVDPDPEEASAEFDDDPAEPIVSANATGIAATAEPTPKATASAPTRPTYDAVFAPAADSLASTVRRRYSIVCTRPLAERR